MLVEVAGSACGGRLVAAHEGGYSVSYVPYCGLAVLEELAGVRTAIEEPNAPRRDFISGQDLQPHQAAIVQQARELIAGIPRP